MPTESGIGCVPVRVVDKKYHEDEILKRDNHIACLKQELDDMNKQLKDRKHGYDKLFDRNEELKARCEELYKENAELKYQLSNAKCVNTNATMPDTEYKLHRAKMDIERLNFVSRQLAGAVNTLLDGDYIENC